MKNILLAALLAFAASAIAAPMTNDDVIKLAKAGLGDATILQAIDGAENGFDTSTDGLVKLKQGGVSDAVIQKILAKKPGAPVAAAAAAKPATTSPQPSIAATAAPIACPECGTITGIREVNKAGSGSGLGAVAGGVVGGILGRSVGGRDHRTAGTVVGVAGGAVAGHMIEKHATAGKTFEIGVRFDDGTSRNFTMDKHPSWKSGDRVRNNNGALTSI
jgi:outer membrane lipoprotein SlyB